MKRTCAVLGGVAVVMLLRLFVISPWISLATIGDARSAVRTVLEADSAELPVVEVADAVQTALFERHHNWLIADVVLDVIIIVIVFVGLRIIGADKEQNGDGQANSVRQST